MGAGGLGRGHQGPALLTEPCKGSPRSGDSLLLTLDAHGPSVEVGAIIILAAAVILTSVAEGVEHPVIAGYPARFGTRILGVK
eukprot:10987010-Lingulodinium_polyedra.AAC.1